jgi:hypothetical protein
MTIRQPASPKTCAWPKPAPEAPPVMKAILPVKSINVDLLFVSGGVAGRA